MAATDPRPLLPQPPAALFARGFFDAQGLLPQHVHESEVRLAQWLLAVGGLSPQLQALALAVRAVGDEAAYEPNAPLAEKQWRAWERLRTEPSLPLALQCIVSAATPALRKRRDLYALYGILSGTLERLRTLVRVARLPIPPSP